MCSTRTRSRLVALVRVCVCVCACVCVNRPSSWAQGVILKRVLGFWKFCDLQGARKGGEGVLANEDPDL